MLLTAAAKVIATLALGLLAASSGWADTWPTRPVRFIVPFPPGGPTDSLSRAYARLMSDILKQQVIVENKPGAGGNLGVDFIAKSVPDGYTIGLGTNGPLAINVTLFSKLPYDPTKDVTPITRFAFVPNVLVVHPGVGAKDLGELIRLVRANPDKYSYASGGNGTSQHLAGEMLNAMLNIKLTHVPYKGESFALTDVIGGQVPMFFSSLVGALPQIKAGKLIPLAVTSTRRNPALPDVPSLAETGLAGYEATAWYGVIAPANTPPDIVRQIHEASVKALQSPEIAQRMAAIGASGTPSSPAEFSDFIRSEINRWAPVIKQSGAKVD